MLAPGFITDAFGVLLLLPPTRAVVRRGLMRNALSRLFGPARHRGPRGRAAPRHARGRGRITTWTRPRTRSTRPSCRDDRARRTRRRGRASPAPPASATPSRSRSATPTHGLYGSARLGLGAGTDAGARERARPAVPRRRARRGRRIRRDRAGRRGGLAASSRPATCAPRSSAAARPGTSPTTATTAASSCASRRSARPAELAARRVAASAAGMQGYEQLCRVSGTVRCGEQRTTVDCLGQRGHQWGAPDWERIALARTVSAWFERRHRRRARERAARTTPPTTPTRRSARRCSTARRCVRSASRCCRRRSTARGASAARASSCGRTATSAPIPHRAAGEAICGTTLDLGRLRLDCAFFRWRMEGREGVGRYDVLRRA